MREKRGRKKRGEGEVTKRQRCSEEYEGEEKKKRIGIQVKTYKQLLECNNDQHNISNFTYLIYCIGVNKLLHVDWFDSRLAATGFSVPVPDGKG